VNETSPLDTHPTACMRPLTYWPAPEAPHDGCSQREKPCRRSVNNASSPTGSEACTLSKKGEAVARCGALAICPSRMGAD
jgi:hypothetical protein